MSVFYMSFCDPSRPAGAQFLGAAIVRAETLEEAVIRSHLLGCNPGGEIAAQGPLLADAVKTDCIERLLTADEARAACA